MSIENMKRTSVSKNEAATYYEKLTVEDGLESNVFKIPVDDIGAIMLDLGGAGTGTIEFTQDSHTVIDAENETYTAWDGVSQINLAVTGFKVVSSSGQVIGTVTVKSRNN